MIKNLVIVESPAKAKTIQSYLGKDFFVVSSYGHIYDLTEKKMGINIKNNFQTDYGVIPEKKNKWEKIQTLARKSETIWLATDGDREGEAISWHIYKKLKISEVKFKRIYFNEITKKAVLHAIENPRSINYDLVNAQKARRILDRIVGFELSTILWRKMKRNLSAGRVQSVVVRLITEREQEIEKFLPTTFYRVYGIFSYSEKNTFKAKLEKTFEKEKEVKDFLKKCHHFVVSHIGLKKRETPPPIPFTTSSLQQEAALKLGYSVSKTMYLAQKLYEEGYITYPRTDSLNLSEEAICEAQKQIISMFGKEYSFPRRYATNKKLAQESHEAIRPTNFKITPNKIGQKLYKLIWKRTLAGQMTNAILEKTNILISPFPHFLSKVNVIIFDGFLKIYKQEKSEKISFPKRGEELKNIKITATQKFTRHPPRYGEASLVKTLEEFGIGRPSTYVTIIKTIQKRGYVEIKNFNGVEIFCKKIELKNSKISVSKKKEISGSEKVKFLPTYIGVIVNNFLIKNFQKILDYQFTAKMEAGFDDIALGKAVWINVIKNFYVDFHSIVEKIKKNYFTKPRFLGIDPKSGKKVLAKIGRFGPVIVQKPKFVSLPKHQYKISLEEALKLLEFSKKLGFFEGKEVILNHGRFGFYLKYGDKFISINKECVKSITYTFYKHK
jgi:DNA topoisomerase I